MIGGRDYALSEFNRSTQAERQTGSSFKPYVYTTAIEEGAKPDDIIVDGPVTFGSYSPHNYENDYKGAMTLTNAFAESRNIPAVKLAARVGIRKVIDMAHRFGVTTDIPAYLPIALGAAEITLAGTGRLPTPSSPTTAFASSRASSGRSPTPTASLYGKMRPPLTRSSTSRQRAP